MAASVAHHEVDGAFLVAVVVHRSEAAEVASELQEEVASAVEAGDLACHQADGVADPAHRHNNRRTTSNEDKPTGLCMEHRVKEYVQPHAGVRVQAMYNSQEQML